MASIRPSTRYTKTLNSPIPSSSAESLPASHDAPSALARKLGQGKKTDREPKKCAIADDGVTSPLLKKNGEKCSFGLGGLHKKLFKEAAGENPKKVLTEVKDNTRTVAMVLRSERELLIENKEQEEEITRLKISLMETNTEAEKLKDLCLKQREEIKSLKSAILFPDSSMSLQLRDLLEKQGSEVRQAKELIPSLQRQVASLNERLQFLADDVAEVKANSGRGIFDNHLSPQMMSVLDDQEYSSGRYPITSDSPDEMILRDLNPCLTPFYAKTKSKEFDIYSSCDDNVEVYGTR